MASRLLNIPANTDIDIKLNFDDYYFSVQVEYTGFDSETDIDANFKILISNVGYDAGLIPLTDNSIGVSDSDGSIMFRNEKPVSAQYAILRYTSNSVGSGEFGVYVASQTEIDV